MIMEEWGAADMAYMRRTGRYGAGNRELMERFKGYLRANGLLRADAAILGIALDDPARTPEAAQRYDVGVVLTGGDPPCGLPVRRIAGGRYAVFEIAHTEEAVAEFWKTLPERLAGLPWDSARPVLERYRGCKIARHLCEICVPLRTD